MQDNAIDMQMFLSDGCMVSIDDDFDLEKIMLSGQCFRVTKIGGAPMQPSGARAYEPSDVQDRAQEAEVNCQDVQPPIYRLIADDKVLYIQQSDGKRYRISCTLDEWNDFWHGYFDLDRSYAEIRTGCMGKDPFIDEAIRYGAGLRVLNQDPWEMLITFIISQRKNIPAITSSVEKISNRFGKPLTTGLEPGLHAFPTPKDLSIASEDALNDCSLGYRTPYIRDAIRKVSAKELDLDAISSLDSDSLLNELMAVKGVGPKVANCIALFGYGRLENVPIDIWIARAIEEKSNGNDPFSQFGENAGIIQQYVFYYMTQTK